MTDLEIVADYFGKWQQAHLANDQDGMLEWQEELWTFIWKGTGPGTGTQISRIGIVMQYVHQMESEERA